ncbi:restriction endonuclease subunit S [Propionivibrio sp.]|uniref:restriction endonuclease subunit S n=1 Tax=Propionivibrio sp. TaxID=2212460 RepID=UPI003BF0FB9A
MIEGLKPYAEYKESGLPWLGRCPSHWSVRRTKILFHERVQKGFPNEPLLAATQTKGVIKKDDYGTRTVTAQKDLHLLKLVEVGDYVISLRSFQGGIEVAHCRGIISPAYTVLKPSQSATSGYYSHFFKAKPFIDSLSLFVTGIREGQNIDYERMSRAEMPLPCEDEQAAIVRFLDYANRKIDGFIRAKRKLIGLLNEQKQAIIQRAVTRGLDPDAPLKPSGISWLGDIPAHWEAKRVKQTTRILRGKFSHRPRNDPSFYDGKYPFIQTGAVARAGKFIASYKQTLNEKGLSVSKLFPSGTLVMTIAANIGDVAILTFEACFPDSIVGFVPAGKLDRDYLYFVFLCMKDELLREAPVNTQGNLSIERIGTMWIPLPPLLEQEQITKYIETETIPLNTAITRTEREIALMQEYRTRLTADIVTGKLDVREAAARLPDLPTDPAGEPFTDEVLGYTDVLDEIEPEES